MREVRNILSPTLLHHVATVIFWKIPGGSSGSGHWLDNMKVETGTSTRGELRNLFIDMTELRVCGKEKRPTEVKLLLHYILTPNPGSYGKVKNNGPFWETQATLILRTSNARIFAAGNTVTTGGNLKGINWGDTQHLGNLAERCMGTQQRDNRSSRLDFHSGSWPNL